MKSSDHRDMKQTIEMSARILLGELCEMTFLQMKSDNVGSSSPMYSTIFLFTHGRIRRSISVWTRVSK